MSQAESRLQRRIRAALELELGGYWWKVHGSRYQPSGLPDLNGTVGGRSCWVEVKEPDGEVSEIQVVRMVELMDAGAAVCVATTCAEACDAVRVMLRRPDWRFCFGCLTPQPHEAVWALGVVQGHSCRSCGRVDR